MRFVILNGIFWSDFHKTFTDELRLWGRILGHNISEQEIEPDLDIDIRNGLVRLWLCPKSPVCGNGHAYGDRVNETIVCQFPLVIFDEFPSELMNLHNSNDQSWWDEYHAIRKLTGYKNMKKREQMVSGILKRYGFARHSKGDIDYNPGYLDRDGEDISYDPDRGYVWYKHPFLTVGVRCIGDK